jgi:hypothetical protein
MSDRGLQTDREGRESRKKAGKIARSRAIERETARRGDTIARLSRFPFIPVNAARSMHYSKH